MAHRGTNFIEVLLATDDAPLIAHMVANGASISEIRLEGNSKRNDKIISDYFR